MSKSLVKKLIIIVVLIGIVILFRAYHLERFLSLEYIRNSQERFAALYAAHPLQVVGAYFVLYVVVAALSLPGATAMTLAGGALFGMWVGLVTVSFASTIGATLACLVARFVLRDWVQNRFGDRLKAINEGIEREGAFYLFTLRLVPIFPFFVINLVMGLTKMPLRTFYWVSQVGMLAGTVVYVNAGKELARIDSLAGIMSPRLLLSFAVLGLFPIIVKKLLTFLRSKSGRPEAS
jgi:uncharacterized membrane protein YdjX (TVP38/TMEM64 family)